MEGSSLRYVGSSVPRLDGEDKVTGRALYVGDMNMPGMLHAVMLGSDLPHARIRSMDLSAARAQPGVVKIYTSADVPALEYNANDWLPDMHDYADERIVTDHPCHQGDRIALVVAESAESARLAAGLIHVEYEALPVVAGIDAALDPSSPPIHPYGNAPFDISKSYGDYASIAARSALIVEDVIETPAQHHAAIEPHACLAYFQDGELTIKTPCQITFQVQMLVSRIIGLPYSAIRVIKALTGGSFGGKSQPVLEPICGFLAYDLGRPVLMTLDREQCILSSRRRNSVRGRVRLALSADGRFLARDLDVIADTGAYYGNGTSISMAMLKKAMRLYRMEAQHYRARTVLTNTPVGGTARGYGSPQIHAVTEINVENAARALGLDPLELRLANIVHTGDTDPLGGPALGSVGLEACLRQGAERFGWKDKLARDPGTGRYRRGIGMAALVHGNGYFGAYPEFSAVRLALLPDGSVLVDTALHDLGCGTMTISTQIAAEAMGVNIDRVRLLEADTLRSPYEPTGSQACRVTYVCGEAIRLGAEALASKVLDQASAVLGLPRDSLHINGTGVAGRDGKELLGLDALVAQNIRKRMEPLAVDYTYEAQANPGTYAANFADVEVDTWTGLVDVKLIVAAHDIGRAINPDFVSGQIYGGVQMNLGYALYEDMGASADGMIKAKSLDKYHLVNAPSMPPVEIVLVENGEPFGPYGAKSIGEPSSIGVAPAVINAINHALGTRLSILPATPERIVAALADGSGAMRAGERR